MWLPWARSAYRSTQAVRRSFGCSLFTSIHAGQAGTPQQFRQVTQLVEQQSQQLALHGMTCASFGQRQTLRQLLRTLPKSSKNRLCSSLGQTGKPGGTGPRTTEQIMAEARTKSGEQALYLVCTGRALQLSISFVSWSLLYIARPPHSDVYAAGAGGSGSWHGGNDLCLGAVVPDVLPGAAAISMVGHTHPWILLYVY